ncbi:MAG: NADH-quinone oxidoreductase subunit J [Vampirovibrionia bacterium]
MENILITLAFYSLAFLCIIGALGVVFNRIIFNSGLFLLISFLSIAGIFILLNSDFIAMAQILIYGVGIAVIIIFAIMLTNPKSKQNIILGRSRGIISLMACFLMFCLMLAAILINPFLQQTPADITIQRLIHEGTSGIIGKALFTVYVLPFEIISVLLLVAIVGAVLLARRDLEKIEEEQN